MRLTDTNLKAKLDSVIQMALTDGMVKELSGKWFKGDVAP